MAPEDTGASQEGTQPEVDTSKADGKSFSQKEVDGLVAQRLSRLETKHKRDTERAVQDGIQAWRAEHGIDDDETLESIKHTDEKNAEARKLKAAATKSANEAQGWQAKFEKVASRLNEALTRDAVMREASTKAVDPEVVWLLASRHLKVDEDYNVIAEVDGKEVTVPDLVDSILSSRRHLARAPTVVGGSGSAQGQPVKPQDKSPDFSSRDVRIANLKSALGG